MSAPPTLAWMKHMSSGHCLLVEILRLSCLFELYCVGRKQCTIHVYSFRIMY